MRSKLSRLAHGHWAVGEIRTLLVRDHCMREGKTRSKNYSINCALSGLRVCLIAIKASVHPNQLWPSIQERCYRDPTIAYQSVAKLGSKYSCLESPFAL